MDNWTALFQLLSGGLAGVGVSALTMVPAMKAADGREHRRELRFIGLGLVIVVALVVGWTKALGRGLAAIDGAGEMYSIAFCFGAVLFGIFHEDLYKPSQV